jgi:hypothetical protein
MAEKHKDSSDQPVLGHIKRLVRLVAEEHKLYNQGQDFRRVRSGGSDPGEATQVRSRELGQIAGRTASPRL